MNTTTNLKHIPLKHLVIAIFSGAAGGKGFEIPLSKFFEIFCELWTEFGESLPILVFNRGPVTTYSKRLDDALTIHICYGIDVVLPDTLSIKSDTAKRTLEWFRERYGETALDALKLISTALAKKAEHLRTQKREHSEASETFEFPIRPKMSIPVEF